ncbi:MAG TPA: hypothetical protein VK698_04535 [Kofleriaceae bacterium]|nr:hypothetical protein [Kofleriaceae bacterium]
MRRAITVGIVSAALAAPPTLIGCGDGGGPATETDGGPPGTDGGGMDDDGGPVDPGMTVHFLYLDADGDPVPADQPIELGGFSIQSLTMELHDAQLTGDSVLGGDLVTRTSVLELPWTEAPSIGFPTAPPGLYSRLDYRVERTYSDEDPPEGFEGERLSIRVLGEAYVDQGAVPFEYVEDHKIDIHLRFEEEVQLDAPGAVAIELDLAGWFSMVDWQWLADDQDGNEGPGGDGDSGPGGGDDDDSGPGGGGDSSGPGGPDDGGPDDGVIGIGRGGDQRVADELRHRLESSFRVGPDPGLD